MPERSVIIRLGVRDHEQLLKALDSAGDAGERLKRRIEGVGQPASASLQAVDKAAADLHGRLSSVGTPIGPVGSALSSLGLAGAAAAAGLGAVVLGLTKAIEAGDKFAQLEGRLKVVAGSSAAAGAAFRDLFQVSQRLGVATEETVQVFARLALGGKELGATRTEMVRLVETVQQFGRISGASQAEAAAGAQQLAQALASGKLQGDELRSILENMPRLAQAIAAGLNVSVGRLREMGSEGQLTGDKVFKAILSQTEKANQEFSALPKSVGQAWTAVTNAVEAQFAELDKALGASRWLVRLLSVAEKGIAPTVETALTRLRAAEQELARGEQQATGRFTLATPGSQRITTPLSVLREGVLGAQEGVEAETIAESFRRTGERASAALAQREKANQLEREAVKIAVEFSEQLDRQLDLTRKTGPERERAKKILEEEQKLLKAFDLKSVLEAPAKLTKEQFDIFQRLLPAAREYGGLIADQEEANKKAEESARKRAQEEEKRAREAKRAREELERAAIKEGESVARAEEQKRKEAEASSKLFREIEQDRQKALDTIRRETDAIVAETDAAGVSNVERAKTIERLKLEEQARRANVDTTTAEFKALVAARLAAVEAREASKEAREAEREALRDAQQAARDFSRVIGTAFEDAIIRGNSFRSVLQGIVDDLIRIALRVTVTKPLTTELENLFSGVSESNPAGAGGFDLFGAARRLFSGGTGGIGSGITSAINDFGATNFGLANVGSDFIGPLQAGQTAGTTLADIGGYAGAAFNVLNFARSPSVGSGITAAASIAAQFLPPPFNIGVPIVASLVSSLFGKKPTVGPTFGVNYNVDPRTGRFVPGGARGDFVGVDNGYDLGQAQQQAGAYQALFNELLTAGGGRFTGVLNIGSTQKGGFTFNPNNVPGGSISVANDVELIKKLFSSSIVEGLNENFKKALTTSLAATVDELKADLTFAAAFEDLFAPAKAATPLTDAIKALTESFEGAKAKAEQLGLEGIDKLGERFDAAKKKIGDDFLAGLDRQIAQLTGGGAAAKFALEDLTKSIRDLAADAASAGVDVGNRLDTLRGLQEAQILAGLPLADQLTARGIPKEVVSYVNSAFAVPGAGGAAAALGLGSTGSNVVSLVQATNDNTAALTTLTASLDEVARSLETSQYSPYTAEKILALTSQQFAAAPGQQTAEARLAAALNVYGRATTDYSAIFSDTLGRLTGGPSEADLLAQEAQMRSLYAPFADARSAVRIWGPFGGARPSDPNAGLPMGAERVYSRPSLPGDFPGLTSGDVAAGLQQLNDTLRDFAAQMLSISRRTG